MSRFLTRLRVELDEHDGEAILIGELVYESSLTGDRYTVPIGFKTDFASTPRLPLTYALAGNVGNYPATLHDYLYQSGLVSRSVADKVFREALEVIGVDEGLRNLMYAAVRVGGAGRYAVTIKEDGRAKVEALPLPGGDTPIGD